MKKAAWLLGQMDIPQKRSGKLGLYHKSHGGEYGIISRMENSSIKAVVVLSGGQDSALPSLPLE